MVLDKLSGKNLQFIPFCKIGTPPSQHKKTGKESLSLLPLSKPYLLLIAVYQTEPVPYVEAAFEKASRGVPAHTYQVSLIALAN